MKTDNTQTPDVAADTLYPPGVAPHDAPTWPYREIDRLPAVLGFHIAHAQEAIHGAQAVARLLHADNAIAGDREALTYPETLPATFSACTREGLHHALSVCLSTVILALEHAEDYGRGRANGGRP